MSPSLSAQRTMLADARSPLFTEAAYRQAPTPRHSADEASCECDSSPFGIMCEECHNESDRVQLLRAARARLTGVRA